MSFKQLNEQEINDLKEKAKQQRAIQPITINSLYQATRIETWVQMQEGKKEILKQCVELHSEERGESEEENANKQSQQPIQSQRQYRLKGYMQSNEEQRQTYEKIFAMGHKSKSQGKPMPTRIRFSR